MKIIFKTKDNPDNQNETKFLFKLYAGSVVEIEMCEIICNKSNIKKICFQVNSRYKRINSGTENNAPNISILTIMSTTISKFYQAIRAGENSIINLEKSYINNNYGKAIVILNPLITKIIETVFDNNIDNALHIKFIKDENLLNESRKIYIKDNEIAYNHGNGIYIDGVENLVFDLDIVISNNTIRRNKLDGVFLCELYLNSLNIVDNKINENKNNGLNITKVYHKFQKITNTSDTLIIKNNEFHDSDMFGILMNDCKAMILNNSFMRNKQSGLILCVLNYLDLYNTEGNKISTNTNSNNISNPDTQFHHKESTHIKQNNFMKNGCNGLKIANYNYLVSISDSKFSENIDYGIYLEWDNLNIEKEKIKSFRDSKQMSKETHVYINNSSINCNLKSGIYLSNCLLYIENTTINDNIDYAIHASKEEFKDFYKYLRDKKNTIVGNIGGSWGENTIGSKTLCTSCTSTVKKKVEKKIIDTSEENKKSNSVENPKKSNSTENKKDGCLVV